MYRAITRNKVNTIVFIVVFLGIVGALGWLASVIYDSWLIVAIVTGVAIVYAIIQYFAAARQAIGLSGARELQPGEHDRLWRTVENLAITEGMPTPRVFVIRDPAPNAFATGRDPEHAFVAATTGLLEIMDDPELEAVMAHEMGHVKNYDIRVSLIVFGLVVAIGMISDFLLRMLFFGGRGRNGGGNPIVLVIGLVAIVVAPLVAALVQLAISRQREYLADATSAMTTRNPDALARALYKLQDNAQPLRRQNASMAHLWIANPLKSSMTHRLFSTHPPIPDRIARLRSIGGHF